jgi:hypothetical protein
MAQEAKRAGQPGPRKGGTEGAQGVEGEREEMAGEGKGDFFPIQPPTKTNRREPRVSCRERENFPFFRFSEL